MPRYTVRVREVHVAYFEIDANTPDDAVQAVVDGGGELVNTEYSHTLDRNVWDVEDEKGNIVKDQLESVGYAHNYGS